MHANLRADLHADLHAPALPGRAGAAGRAPVSRWELRPGRSGRPVRVGQAGPGRACPGRDTGTVGPTGRAGPVHSSSSFRWPVGPVARPGRDDWALGPARRPPGRPAGPPGRFRFFQVFLADEGAACERATAGSRLAVRAVLSRRRSESSSSCPSPVKGVSSSESARMPPNPSRLPIARQLHRRACRLRDSCTLHTPKPRGFGAVSRLEQQ